VRITSLAVSFFVLTLAALTSTSVLGWGSYVFTGMLEVNDPQIKLVEIEPSTDLCIGETNFTVPYEAVPFSVSENGMYHFSDADVSYVGIIIYEDSFNTLNVLQNCVKGAVGNTPNLSVELKTKHQYYIVFVNVGSSASPVSYDWEVSSAGDILIGIIPPSPSLPSTKEPPFVFADGRLNDYDTEATVALYCTSDYFDVYGINADGVGWLAFRVTQAEIDVVDTSEGNALVRESSGIRLFKLTDRTVQIVGIPNAEGKVYNIIFDPTACEVHDSFEPFR
jgi:hypothetical protein